MKTRHKFLIITFLVMIMSIFFIACAGTVSPTDTTNVKSGPTPTPTPLPIEGYLSVDKDGIYWVEWLEDGDRKLLGKYLANTNKKDMPTFEATISGVHQGERINLTIKYLFVEIPAAGTLKDNVLTLQIENRGETKSRIFKGTTFAEYKKEVDSFRKKYPLPPELTPTATATE